MTYLIISEHADKVDTKIAELKQKILDVPDALYFDYEILYGSKLDAGTLQKTFKTLPVIASKRLVVLRDCHKLNDACKTLVTAFASSAQEYCVLILGAGSLSAKDSFYKNLSPFCEIERFAKPEQVDVFDMTQAIANHRPQQALNILKELLDSGAYPLQMIGGILWFWSHKAKLRLSSERYEEGLLALQAADLSIKRSRLKPESAMEILVAKLYSLMTG